MNVVKLGLPEKISRPASLRWSTNRKIGILLSNLGTPDGKDYAAIWNHEQDESPLKTISRAQAVKLATSQLAAVKNLRESAV